MLEHPYKDLPPIQEWQRGNLHSHTTRTDGQQEPQAVIDAYAKLGYDFLALTDHDIFTGETEYAEWESRGLTLLPGNEVTAHGPHLLHVGARERIEPHEDRQKVLDEAAASGGFIVCNHPDWQHDFNHCPIESLENWNGYAGLEIFNGTIGRLPGSPYALNKWDRLLSKGRRVWGFATDDSHTVSEDIGLGWVVAAAAERTPESLVEALRAGRFYASSGVAIREIVVTDGRIRVDTEEPCRFVALCDFGRRLAVAEGRRIEVDVPSSLSYVRIECWGAGEQFAWTQPFFVSA